VLFEFVAKLMAHPVIKNDKFPLIQVLPDDLVLTCGATSGLHLAASTLLNPGGETVIFVECPTYFIAMDILQKGTDILNNCM